VVLKIQLQITPFQLNTRTVYLLLYRIVLCCQISLASELWLSLKVQNSIPRRIILFEAGGLQITEPDGLDASWIGLGREELLVYQQLHIR
jgi:hypothetical protein